MKEVGKFHGKDNYISKQTGKLFPIFGRQSEQKYYIFPDYFSGLDFTIEQRVIL